MAETPFMGIDAGQPSFARLCASDPRYNRYRPYFLLRSYPAGQCVHAQGAPITHLGVVMSGILRAASCFSSGQEASHTYFEPEDSFPELLYLTGKRCYTYSLYVEKRAAVLWIPLGVLEQMLTGDPVLMSALLLYVCQRGLKNQLYLNCLGYQTIRQRVAYWAVGVQKLGPGQAAHMLCSQKVFADLLHVSRSSLNQELKQMEREGYFRLQKGRICQVEAARLEELL